MGIPEWLQGMLNEGRYADENEMSYEWRIPADLIYQWRTARRVPSVSSCIRLADATMTPLEQVVRMAAATEEARKKSRRAHSTA